MSTREWSVIGVVMAVVAVLLLGGCRGSASLIPNPDPALRRSTEEFAADAVRRFPYKADAPRGDAKETPARAQVQYGLADQIELVNLSETEDFENVEVWVNKTHVVYLPRMEKKITKRLPFRIIYDDHGGYFKVTKEQPRVSTLEIYRNGKMYTVQADTAD